MANEWLNDARKIPDDVMSYIRKLAVRAVVERGWSPECVFEIPRFSKILAKFSVRERQQRCLRSTERLKPPPRFAARVLVGLEKLVWQIFLKIGDLWFFSQSNE